MNVIQIIYNHLVHWRPQGELKSSTVFITKHNLINQEYLGDGDTSSYEELVDSKLYVDYSIITEKLECVRHAQKRLGTRRCTKVKEYKGTATPLSGAGKLTEKTINSLKNYYGKAIRSNSNELYAMKKAGWCSSLALRQIRQQRPSTLLMPKRLLPL